MSRKQETFRSVLIFGGAGFIGSNWAHRLLDTTDAKVHIFDNLSRPGVRHNLESLQRKAGNSGRLQITVADVRDATRVERAVRFATEIYHFAAQVAVTTSVEDPRLDFDVNLGGTFNVLEAARKAGRKPFMLFTSTNKVYGQIANRPIIARNSPYEFLSGAGVSEAQPLDFHSPYGCSKGGADQYWHDYARIYGLPSVVFRMSCICGPRQFGTEDQGWVAHFLYSALHGRPLVIYGDGRQMRDLLYIDDLLRAFELARENQAKTAGQVFNIGGGPEHAVSLLTLISNIERLTGRNVDYAFDERRPGDQLLYITDTSRFEEVTGWKPQVHPPQALKKMYDWWKRNRELFPANVFSDVVEPVGATLDQMPRVA
jgi:CDP-paratose 2-epimerase